VRRTGLGRHGGLDDAAGDPLDGLVNLFDLGIVLAVAFLVAGLGLTGGENRHTRAPAGERPAPRGEPRQTTVPLPPPAAGAPRAVGRGEAVGQVYRLSDGRLVLVRDGR
jgi:hypothetical protein